MKLKRLTMNTTGMSKSERIEAAKMTFANVDEYEPHAAIAALACEFDIDVSDAQKIVCPPSAHATRREYIGSCHYCGQPAYGRGWFDEPACDGCGG
jgi:hypothetical protein